MELPRVTQKPPSRPATSGPTCRKAAACFRVWQEKGAERPRNKSESLSASSLGAPSDAFCRSTKTRPLSRVLYGFLLIGCGNCISRSNKNLQITKGFLQTTHV